MRSCRCLRDLPQKAVIPPAFLVHMCEHIYPDFSLGRLILIPTSIPHHTVHRRVLHLGNRSVYSIPLPA
jgi:hypothetical protein